MTWEESKPAPDGDVLQLLLSGDKIGAIKLVRERKSLGLKEAKDYVDAIEAGIDPALRAAAGTNRSSGCVVMMLYILGLAALIYAVVRLAG